MDRSVSRREQVFRAIRLSLGNFYFQRRKSKALFVLMFHQVNDDKVKYYPGVPIAVFDGVCRFLRENIKVILFSEVNDHFRKSTKPAAIISFDDGSADIREHVFPIIRKYDLKLNVNIDTEILETGVPQDNLRIYATLNSTKAKQYTNLHFFDTAISLTEPNPYTTERKFSKLLSKIDHESRRELSEDVLRQLGGRRADYPRVLTKADLKELAEEGVEIGSHSHTHSILTNLTPEEVDHELTLSKSILEDVCDMKIDVLAYPNGMVNPAVAAAASRAGYRYLLETGDTANSISQIPMPAFSRINMYPRTTEESLAQLFGVYQAIRRLREALR